MILILLAATALVPKNANREMVEIDRIGWSLGGMPADKAAYCAGLRDAALAVGSNHLKDFDDAPIVVNVTDKKTGQTEKLVCFANRTFTFDGPAPKLSTYPNAWTIPIMPKGM